MFWPGSIAAVVDRAKADIDRKFSENKRFDLIRFDRASNKLAVTVIEVEKGFAEE